jgi:hypothetical protein
MDTQEMAFYRWTSRLDEMAQFHYRQEDQFREESNARKLKELHQSGDFTGLLEFALLLNHEASFNNSKVRWALSEALEVVMPVSDKHLQMANETIKDLAERMLQRARESGESIF